jgi:Xaa-Pro aminopeptidase
MNRLDALRMLIKEHEYDAYLITDSDAHYTFYSLAREDRRINWITQCQAQCGLALVTLNNKAVFQVPPNYRLLAKAEMNENIWLIVDDIVEWLCQLDADIGIIGYDPRLTPWFVMQSFSKFHLHPIGLSSINLIDAISNQETTTKRHILTPIWLLDEHRFAGQTSEDKLSKLRQNYLNDSEIKYTLITTAMDEIAWLLNLRANDMQCNPLFYSFMIVSNDQLIIFTDNPHEVR